MSVIEQTREGLAAYLSKEWGTEVTVGELQLASAGARRRNVLFSATRASEQLALVATIIPNKALQVMPISVEASNLRLAEAAGVPVPHVFASCEDDTWVGGAFFITGRVDGETIPRQVLRLVEATPGLGKELTRQCGAALARLHAVDAETAHPDLPRPTGDPVTRGLAGVEDAIAALLQPSPAFSLAFRWLGQNRPAPSDRLAIVHGDFRNGNLIVDADGLAATLDWEVCHLGEPMEDLGWLCQRMWRFRNDSLEVGGFGSRADLRAGYEEAGGVWDAETFHWWKTFGTLRWGLGLALQAAQHLDGSVPNIVMAASGRRVAELEYDTLMLLRRVFE